MSLERIQIQKEYCMIPFIRNVPNIQIHRDRKETNDCQEFGGGETEIDRQGVWVSFWGAENIPKLDSGGGCTTW